MDIKQIMAQRIAEAEAKNAEAKSQLTPVPSSYSIPAPISKPVPLPGAKFLGAPNVNIWFRDGSKKRFDTGGLYYTEIPSEIADLRKMFGVQELR